MKSIFFWDMTSGTTQRTTRRHIPEEDTLQNHRCENLKSYILYMFIVSYNLVLIYRQPSKDTINMYRMLQQA
jgi:hypothetical protein